MEKSEVRITQRMLMGDGIDYSLMQLLHKLTERLLREETITFNDIVSIQTISSIHVCDMQREVLGERPHPLKAEYARYVEASPNKRELGLADAGRSSEGKDQAPSDGGNNGATVLDENSGIEKKEKGEQLATQSSSETFNQENLQRLVSGLMTPIVA